MLNDYLKFDVSKITNGPSITTIELSGLLSEEMSLGDIVAECHKNQSLEVILKGDSLLLDKQFEVLVYKLITENFNVKIHTSGEIDFHPFVDKMYSYDLPLEIQSNYAFVIEADMSKPKTMNHLVFEHLDDLMSKDIVEIVCAPDYLDECMDLLSKCIDQGLLCKVHLIVKESEIDVHSLIKVLEDRKMDTDVQIIVDLED